MDYMKGEAGEIPGGHTVYPNVIPRHGALRHASLLPAGILLFPRLV